MRKTRKPIIALVAVALVAALGVGATVAWLTDTSETVTNTFTSSDVDIELTETTGGAYKMVPGDKIDKDPVVTVKAGSEECYLFVKVEKSNVLETYIDYVVDPSWKALGESYPGVYYQEVPAATADTSFNVIGYMDGSTFVANKVLVKGTVTKAQMDALEVSGAEQPTLTFTAYAIQKANTGTAAEAWAKIGS